MRREKSRTRGGGTEQERKMRMRRARGERKRRKWGEARELRGQRSKDGGRPMPVAAQG